MNKAQRIVLVVGLLVAVAMATLPPWVSQRTRIVGGHSYTTGISTYRFVWMQSVGRKISESHVIPQKAGSMLGFHKVVNDGTDMYYWRLDLSRLLVQLLGTGLLTAAGYVLVGGRKAGQVEAAEPKDDDTSS